MRFFLLTLFFVCSCFAESAFPKVQGNLLHLKKENSPYVLNETFLLAKKDTLKIDAGVEVRMGSFAKLLINGTAFILGNTKEPVRFVALDSLESWNGIHFLSGNNPFTIKNLIVEKAFRNTISETGGVIENSKFIDNYYGLWIYSSLVVLKNCSFERNRFAISANASTISSENLSVTKNIFGLFLEGNSKFEGSENGIRENMESDIREGSVATNKERIPLSVWKRLEASF